MKNKTKKVAVLFKPPSYSGWRPPGMRRRGLSNRASQTPGALKSVHCKLTKIGGLHRKAYCRSRGRNLKNYHIWCAFGDAAKNSGR